MDDYQKMYYTLFNKITDVIDKLTTIQKDTEEIFLSEAKSCKKIQIDAHNKGFI